MADYKVILSRRADNMLIKHTEFLARVSPSAARRLLADFRKVIRVLEKTPFQYPFADETDAPGADGMLLVVTQRRAIRPRA